MNRKYDIQAPLIRHLTNVKNPSLQSLDIIYVRRPVHRPQDLLASYRDGGGGAANEPGGIQHQIPTLTHQEIRTRTGKYSFFPELIYGTVSRAKRNGTQMIR